MEGSLYRGEPVALSARNPRLQRLRKLVRNRRLRTEEGLLVVDGPVLVAEALAAEVTVTEVFASPSTVADLASMDLPAGVDLFTVEESVLTSVLDPVSPRPLAAVVEQPTWSLADLGTTAPVLVAVELRDPGNLGTILRTADAAGMAGVVLVGSSVDRWNPKVVRASAGSVLRTPIIAFDDVEEAFGALRGVGRTVVATSVAADGSGDSGLADRPAIEAYDETDLTGAAIVVGNEPHGLDAGAFATADRVVTIPMAAGAESLNVAAATAVLCFEAAAQRRRAGNSLDRIAAGDHCEQ